MRSTNRYQRNMRTTVSSSGAACLEIIAGLKEVLLCEVVLSTTTTTGGTVGIGRPAAIGVGPTTPVAPLALNNSGQVPLARLAVAWGTTAPTVPAAFFRQTSIPVLVGSNVTWNFTRTGDGRTLDGIIIPAGGSVVVWNVAAIGVSDIMVVIEE